jgi:integrase
VRANPAHHDLDPWLQEYLDAAGIAGQDDKTPLFRAAAGKRKQLTAARYRAHSMRQMMKRRLVDAGLPHLFSPHSFRVTVVTDLLNQNVPPRRRSVPRRALEPEDHADLRSQAAARDQEYCREDFDLRDVKSERDRLLPGETLNGHSLP